MFRSRGLRVTPQRHAIFRALTDATRHPTAEGVYAAVCTELPMISLRTVYQTLNDLSAMGELSALNLGTGSTRFDPNLEPHHHLVCEVCGRIEDLHHEFPGVLLPAHGSREVHGQRDRDRLPRPLRGLHRGSRAARTSIEF